jgi:hypothetical protein
VTVVRFAVSGSLPVDARPVPTTDGSRVAYIFLPSFFDRTVVDQVRQAIETLRPQDGLIIDNRLSGII